MLIPTVLCGVRDSRDSEDCGLIKVERLVRMWLDFGHGHVGFVM